MNNRWSLIGKNALITGGSRGIGRSIAEEFLNLGAKVLIVARSEEDLRKTVNEFEDDFNGKIFGISADVTKAKDRLNIFQFVEENFLNLDILVNNAGTNIRKRTLEFTEEDLDKLFSLNFRSAYEMCRLAYPFLAKSGNSSIVNIGSTAGKLVIRTGSAYASAKAGIAHLTRYLSVEWAAEGIRVNAIEPWYIRTPLTKPVLQNEKALAKILERTPMNRIGNPEDIAGLAAYLCMESAAYITGQVIAVDGGATSLLL